jgi:hypothetical protein
MTDFLNYTTVVLGNDVEDESANEDNEIDSENESGGDEDVSGDDG